MLGAITGDTIGSTYEFNNTKDYGFKLFLRDSSYTHDSIMTMAVALEQVTKHFPPVFRDIITDFHEKTAYRALSYAEL